EDLFAAAVALVRAGHGIGPAVRVCPPRPEPVASNETYVGAWALTRREEPVGKTVEEPELSEGPLRIQAPSGVFVEVRLDKSCAGIAVMDRKMSVRHRLVDFQPPTGRVLCTQVKFNKEVMAELSHPRGRFRDEYVEAWTRLHSGPVAALELLSEQPAVTPPRAGFWIFCGNRFGRVIGLPVGQGAVGGTCCKSVAQLEALGVPAREELHTRYEALWGEIEVPGRLRVREEAWSKSRSGDLLYDQASGVGGSLSFVPGEVVHRLPSGVVQRWRIRDWGFDPFRPGAPPLSWAESQARRWPACAEPLAGQQLHRSIPRMSSLLPLLPRVPRRRRQLHRLRRPRVWRLRSLRRLRRLRSLRSLKAPAAQARGQSQGKGSDQRIGRPTFREAKAATVTVLLTG
ncbi:unnamed protein product, partial [Effrenium voratum]